MGKGKISKRFAAVPVLVLAAFTLAEPAPAAESFVTPAGSTTSGGGVKATVTFSVLSEAVIITLENLFWNPTTDSQLISGVIFDVTGAAGTGGLTHRTVNCGGISYIDLGGAYTAPVADPLERWHASESGITISLTATTGGTPNRLIIGPDNVGGFSQGGSYTSANASITGIHDPSVLGWATFYVGIPGVTADSIIENVKMQFGTAPNDTTTVVTLEPVPEPTALRIMLFPLGYGILWYWRRHRAA